MTTANPTPQAWASKPLGKATRVALAVGGLTLATLALLTAPLLETGAWALALVGVSLAAASVRAARVPSASRLIVLMATVVAIPLSLKIF